MSYTFSNSDSEDEISKKESVPSRESAIEIGDIPLPNNASPDSPIGMSSTQLYTCIAGLMVGLFLSFLDFTIVSTALPNITADFGRLDLYAWVIIAYMLTSTTAIPISGKLSDIFGRKILFMSGILLFMLGSILCATATSMIMLICTRAVQGLGGGTITALNQVIMANIVTPRARGKYSNVSGAVFAIASILGPVVGGIITEKITWRWIFWINLPLCAMAIVVVHFTLKIPGDTIKLKGELFKKIDYLGALGILLSVVFLMTAISLGGATLPWSSPTIISLFILGALILVLFCLWENFMAKYPIISMRLLKVRNVALCSVISVCFGWAMFSVINYVPVYFQVVLGDSPTVSGLKMLPLLLGLIFSVTVVGRLLSRFGYYYPMPVVGAVLILLSFSLLGSLLTPTVSIYVISVILLLGGLGMGCALQIVTLIAQFSVERKDLSVATSTVYFLRTIGGVVGVSIYGAILNNELAKRVDPEYLSTIQQGHDAIVALDPTVADHILLAYCSSLQLIVTNKAAGLALIVALLVESKKMEATVPQQRTESQKQIEPQQIESQKQIEPQQIESQKQIESQQIESQKQTESQPNEENPSK